MRAVVIRNNFGIKSFYPKIGGHVLRPKFGSNEKTLSFENHQREAEIFNKIG